MGINFYSKTILKLFGVCVVIPCTLFEVITNNNSKNNQLWIYKYQDKRSVMLTFTNYKLIKIED